MDKEKKLGFQKYIDLSTIIGAGVGVLGAVATVFAAVKTEENGFLTVFVLSVVLEVVALIMLVLQIIEKFRHKIREDELTAAIEAAKEECIRTKAEVDEKIKELNRDHENVIKHLSTISASIKNNSIHNNELLVKVPSKGDESYRYSDLVIDSNLDDNKKREALIQDAQHYATELFDVFKRYCSDMLFEVIKLETAYIKIRGYDLRISATIKLFDKSYTHNIDRRTEFKVYTAFRDNETYEDKNDQGLPRREIGQRLYSIDGNIDFTDCLLKDAYFINNASRNMNNYRNEHEDFDEFYNCTIVVPIRTKLPDGNKMFFGYLCCDCFNDKYPGEEIFDKGAAQYLFAFAQNLATFIETLDTNWLDRFSDEAVDDIPSSAIEMIYNKTFRFTQ